MADIRLFRITDDGATEVARHTTTVEKHVQTLFEQHMDTFLGVRFLATEYSTGKKHGGRIDSLGIDENNCPVIVEYKRSQSENVINQGLYYLEWLIDHRAEFEQLAAKGLGGTIEVDWSAPRVLCIAGDFTKYDAYAVGLMGRNIELLRYRRYGADLDLLLLELINPTAGSQLGSAATGKSEIGSVAAEVSISTQQIVDALNTAINGLGDDIQRKALKFYVAYQRLRNFACIILRRDHVLTYVRLDPLSVSLEKGFSRDVRRVGHYGTGDLELRLTKLSDVEKAMPLIGRSYEFA